MIFLKNLICRMEKHPKTIWSITAMYALLIFYLSSIPITQPPPVVEIPFIDVVEHIVEYAILGGLLLISFRSIKRDGVFAVILLVFLYGFSDEVHQLFTPGRFFDTWDIAADFAGGIIGVFVVKKETGWRHKK